MTTRPISEIWFDRETRQRQELGDLSSLIASIQRFGLINPITITADGQLIAGERRFTACREIGLLEVPVRYFEDLTPRQLKLIELDENVKRKDIEWKEHVRAVKEYNDLSLEENPDMLASEIADELGMNAFTFSRHLGIAQYLADGHEGVVNAPQLSTARGIWERAEQRKKAADLDEVDVALGNPTRVKTEDYVLDADPSPIADTSSAPIYNEDFFTFTSERKFNFIHCDFPYGINADKHDQGASDAFGGYEDSKELYDRLLDQLDVGLRTYVADSAHLMFWFSMEYYYETLDFLESSGWMVNPFPLVWHKSDNSGILPDPTRGPRRVYETAFLGSRGDRPIVRSVSNCISTPSTKEIHMSEKPRPVLNHFFRMFVDEYTVMLDPTCGSGNAVIAAHNAGAATAIGLEINPEFHKLATENWHDKCGIAN